MSAYSSLDIFEVTALRQAPRREAVVATDRIDPALSAHAMFRWPAKGFSGNRHLSRLQISSVCEIVAAIS
jgi:hypothetical protein